MATLGWTTGSEMSAYFDRDDFGSDWQDATAAAYDRQSNLEPTDVTSPESTLFQWVLHRIIVPILFGIITVVGASGNVLVIYVIVAKPRMRTVTNLLLLSLAGADLAFVLVVPPFTAYQMALDNWPFGDIACRLMHYLVNVAAYVTVYTLVVIAGLRYATVVHGVSTARFRTRRNSSLAAGAIWAVMMAVNVPVLLSYGVKEEQDVVICDINGRETGQGIFATFFCLAYVLPLGVIAIFSLCIVRHLTNVEKTSSISRSRGPPPPAASGGGGGGGPNSSTSSSAGAGKRRTKDKKRHAGRLLVLVVVLFAILWLPIHVHLLVAFFGSQPESEIYQVASVLFSCLAYFNSCVNPFIYNHASKEFRDAFVEVARCGRSTKSTSGTTSSLAAAPGSRTRGHGSTEGHAPNESPRDQCAVMAAASIDGKGCTTVTTVTTTVCSTAATEVRGKSCDGPAAGSEFVVLLIDEKTGNGQNLRP